MELPGDTGQRILVCTAEPASLSATALNLLASWAATPVQAPTNQSTTNADTVLSRQIIQQAFLD